MALLEVKDLHTSFFTDAGEVKSVNGVSFNLERGKVLGIVSDKYKIVQNHEAFDFTDSLIGEGCTYETAGSLKGGKKVFLLAKLPQKMIIEDAVDPYVCFTNSHDGFGAIQACMTPIRVVCNNTLNLALSKATRKWSTKHVGDIDNKLEKQLYDVLIDLGESSIKSKVAYTYSVIFPSANGNTSSKKATSYEAELIKDGKAISFDIEGLTQDAAILKINKIDFIDFYSNKSFAYIMKKENSVDIDDELDFILAEKYLTSLNISN